MCKLNYLFGYKIGYLVLYYKSDKELFENKKFFFQTFYLTFKCKCGSILNDDLFLWGWLSLEG